MPPADAKAGASAGVAAFRAERHRARQTSIVSQSDSLVVFTPAGKRGRFPAGTPVLKAARQLGVDIDSVCGGRGICGRCQIVVGEGEFAKHGIVSRADHVTAWNEVEARYDAKRGIKSGRRLSCCPARPVLRATS
jgi:uncharacterized 2Fe-2S/4Fe-4S cluster protein (DUF4445 family)